MNIKYFINGRFYGSATPRQYVECLITENGFIKYAGNEKEAEEMLGNAAYEVVDMHGSVVMPGFVDAHIHPDLLSESMHAIDLKNVRSIKRLKEVLQDNCDKSESEWITGYGWNESLFEEGKLPTRFDIDEVISDKAVILIRSCLHMAVVNSYGLDKAGIKVGDYQHDPDLIKNGEGVSTGLVREDLLFRIYKKIRTDTAEIFEKWLEKTFVAIMNKGITSIGITGADHNLLTIIGRVKRKGIKLRVVSYITADELDCYISTRHDPEIDVRGIKIFMDGSLGSGTASLTAPYCDNPESSGVTYGDTPYFAEICQIAKKHGLQIAVHAIGDRAMDLAIDLYSKIGKGNRIEHCSLTRNDQIDKIKNTGAIAVIQPLFAVDDVWAVNKLGMERMGWLYTFRRLYDEGIPVVFSSDAPSGDFDPWKIIHAAVTGGAMRDHHTESRRFTLSEGLQCYTENGAMAIGIKAGKLINGYHADFIVIDKDPYKIPVSELPGISVKEVYISAEKVDTGLNANKPMKY